MRATSRFVFALLVGVPLTSLPLGAQDDVQKCDKPIGTLAVVEPQRLSLSSRSRYSLGGAVAAGIGGYTDTTEGKLIAASFSDNYNQIVNFVKKDATLVARAGRFKPAGLEGDQLKAGATFAEGSTLTPKIDNVKLFETPTDGAKVVATLKKGVELIFLGTEKDGYLQVQGADGEGWVRKVLVGKK